MNLGLPFWSLLYALPSSNPSLVWLAPAALVLPMAAVDVG